MKSLMSARRPALRAFGALAFLLPAAHAATASDGVSLSDRAARLRVAAGVTVTDLTAPVLRVFDLRGAVQASRSGQSVQASLYVTDNLSGVQSYAVQLRSPSGQQQLERWYNLPVPSRSVRDKLSIGGTTFHIGPSFSQFTEPGEWVVSKVTVMDLNGNHREYGTAALEAMGGNVRFTVVNPTPDGIAPVLDAGVVDTPIVSISTPPPGSSGSPFVSVTLQVRDSGQVKASGVWNANMMYCLPDPAGGCQATLQLTGEVTQFGQSAVSLKLGGRTWYAPPGVYHPVSLLVNDASMLSTGTPALGCPTTLAECFPAGATITLTP